MPPYKATPRRAVSAALDIAFAHRLASSANVLIPMIGIPTACSITVQYPVETLCKPFTS